MPTYKNGSLDPANPTIIAPLLPLLANTNQTFELGNSQTGPTYFAFDAILGAVGTTTFTTAAGTNVTANITATVLSHVAVNIEGDSSFLVDGSLVGVGSSVSASFSGTADGTLGFTPGFLGVLPTIPDVSGFQTGDQINFNSSYDTTGTNNVVYDAATGSLTLFKDGVAEGSVTLNGTYVQGDFHVADVNGSAEIVGCFLRGTRIATAAGETAVENLRTGDLVMTLSNGLREVKSVKRRSFSKPAQLASKNIRPVRIAAGAFAEAVPSRDLCVSPDHAMYLDDVLVPALLLVNGETITQPPHHATADYFHVEVEPHDIILAEGAASETYLDIGNVNDFAAPGVITLYPKMEPKNWEDACAPLVLAGPQLARIRAELASRAAGIAARRDQVSEVLVRVA